MRDIFPANQSIRLHTSHVTDTFQDIDNLQHTRANCHQGLVFAAFVKPPVGLLIRLPRLTLIDSVLLETFSGRHSARKVGLYLAGNWVLSAAATGNSGYDREASDAEVLARMEVMKPAAFINIPLECARSPLHFHLAHQPSSPTQDSSTHPTLHALCHNTSSTRTGGVRCLLIRILATHNSTLPAISRLEIWTEAVNQEPSGSSLVHNPSVAATALSSLKQEDCTEEPNDVSSDVSRVIEQDTSSVPDEFLDPITLDIMVRPVLLPSGKYVDKSTLDRFWSERRPNQRRMDPFTLLHLADPDSLVVDFFLRARIQSFLASITSTTSITQTTLPVDLQQSSNHTLQQPLLDVPQILGSLASQQHLKTATKRPCFFPPIKLDDEDDLDLATERAITRFPWLTATSDSTVKRCRTGSCDNCGRLLDAMRRGDPVYRIQGCGSQICASCVSLVSTGTVACSACHLHHTSSQIHRVHDNNATIV